MSGGREAGHVGADLGEDHLRRAIRDAGDPNQQIDRRFMRALEFDDLFGELGDRGVGVVDAGQHHRAQPGVMFVETPIERVGQLTDLGTHPTLGHVGQHRRVTLPGDEGVDHLPTGLGRHREVNDDN